MSLNRDAQQINLSLRQRIGTGELFALALAFSAAGLFLGLSPDISYAFFDFKELNAMNYEINSESMHQFQ